MPHLMRDQRGQETSNQYDICICVARLATSWLGEKCFEHGLRCCCGNYSTTRKSIHLPHICIFIGDVCSNCNESWTYASCTQTILPQQLLRNRNGMARQPVWKRTTLTQHCIAISAHHPVRCTDVPVSHWINQAFDGPWGTPSCPFLVYPAPGQGETTRLSALGPVAVSEPN